MRSSNYRSAPDEFSERSPERRLLVALLRRAILDYLSSDTLEAIEAQEWLFSEEAFSEYHDDFSFNWICEQLGIETSQLLKQLKVMEPKEEQRRVLRKLN